MLNLKARIVVLVIGCTVLTTMLLVAVTVFRSSTTMQACADEIMILAREQTAGTAKDIWLMCRIADEAQQAQAAGLDAVMAEFAQLGPADTGGPQQQWTALNQLTRDKWTLNLPGLRFGGQPLSQDYLDELGQRNGCDIVVYQRMSESGELLRVKTTLTAADGSYLTGSYIPAMDHQNSVQHPMVGATLRNERYSGSSIILGERRTTSFIPFTDRNGEAIGGVQVLPNEFGMASLREGIMDIVVGKTGYAFVLDSDGTYLISKSGMSDGKDIWEAKDCDGVLFIQEMIQKAIATTDGQVDFHRYTWQNEGEWQPRYKIVAVTYYEPWDWVIGAGCYEDDFQAALLRVKDAQTNTLFWMLGFGLVILVVVVILGFIVASRVEQESFTP